LGALVVAGLVRLLVAREPFDGASWWLLERNVPVSARGVLNDAILLFNPGTLTGVLWSLRWEVLFSLMLPFFVALAQLTARTQAWLVGVLISFVMLGSQLVSLPSDLFFLPMFGLGVLLASREAALRRAGTHRMMVRPLWWLATAAAISLLMAKWFLVWISVGWSSAQRTRIAVAGNLTSALGSGLLVVLALVSPSLAVLARRPVLWLGSRSFSLYLVHEPIVVSAAYLAEGWNPLSAAVGIAISLIVAEVFYRVVERRSIVFAARAASRANQALESATPA
jgi:peptidoglycan/LPS O-acetylase OafA/YrhL